MLPSQRTTHEQQQQRTQLAHASHTGCTTRLQMLRAAGAWRSSCYLWLIVAVLVWMAVGRMISFCCSCFLQACAVLECSSSARRVMLVCDNVSLQAAINGVGACSG